MYATSKLVFKIAAPSDTFSTEAPQWMAGSVLRTAAERISDYCSKFHQPKLEIVFALDEPSNSTSFLREAIDTLRSLAPSSCELAFSIQTNHWVLDEGIVALCAELGIQVRVNLNNQDPGSALQSVAKTSNMDGLLWCVLAVDPEKSGVDTYREARSLGTTQIDFRLPDTFNWDNPPARLPAETPFADFLIPVFDQWWNDNDRRMRISFFEDLLGQLVGSRVQFEALGGDPLTTIVVDHQGDWAVADSLRACGDGFAHLGLNVQHHSIERTFQHPALRLALTGQESLSNTCRRCELVDVCGGGHLASRFGGGKAFDNPSVYCADLTKLIRHVVDVCTTEVPAN